MLPKDTVIVRIDPEDYRLTQRRYESEAAAREAQLKELQETEKNLLEIRQLQKEQLDLAEKDLARLQGLLDGGAVTESTADAARTAHLTRLLAFQETTNSLGLIPVLRARAEAERDVANVQVAEAKREIEKCTIRLPFDARCVTKSIEQDQYINAGQELGTFLDMETAEVVAMVESRKGRSLFPHGLPGLGPVNMAQAVQNEELYRGTLGLLDAEIHWGTPPRRGKVTRIGSSLDPATRTFSVIIEVADPYAEMSPGVRPPLVPDVFCEVTLYGATVDDVIVVPRDSLHEVPRTSLSDEVVPVVYLLEGGQAKGSGRRDAFRGRAVEDPGSGDPGDGGGRGGDRVRARGGRPSGAGGIFMCHASIGGHGSLVRRARRCRFGDFWRARRCCTRKARRNWPSKTRPRLRIPRGRWSGDTVFRSPPDGRESFDAGLCSPGDFGRRSVWSVRCTRTSNRSSFVSG